MIYKTIDLSRLIDKMYKEGLLDTNSNAKKKTGKEITITPKGLQILKEININDGGMFLQADYLSEKNAQSINEALQDTLLKIKGFFK